MPEENAAQPPHAPAGGSTDGEPAKTTAAPTEGASGTNPDPATLTPEAKAAAEKGAAEAKVKAEADAKAVADKTAAETKAKEEAAKASVVSADKLKLPEGSLIPQSRLDEIAKENPNLSLEQAQKMVDAEHATAARVLAASTDSLKAQGEKWLAELKADPKLGGDNLNRTNQLAYRALKTLFGEQFVKELQNTPWQYRPDLVRGAVKFAEMAGESRLEKGEAPAKTEAPKSLGEMVYGPKDKYNPLVIGGGAQ